MQKTYVLLLSAFLLVTIVAMSVSAVSSVDVKTVIGGKVYDSPNFEKANGVPGATVYVTCGANTATATTKLDGTYIATFSTAEGCTDKSTLTAYAISADGKTQSKTESGTVDDYTNDFNLYLGVVNIALVPEFGVGVGLLTLLSAMGIFFFIRKK